MIGFVFELDNLFEVYDILYSSKMKTCIHIYIYIYIYVYIIYKTATSF